MPDRSLVTVEYEALPVKGAPGSSVARPTVTGWTSSKGGSSPARGLGDYGRRRPHTLAGELRDQVAEQRVLTGLVAGIGCWPGADWSPTARRTGRTYAGDYLIWLARPTGASTFWPPAARTSICGSSNSRPVVHIGPTAADAP